MDSIPVAIRFLLIFGALGAVIALGGIWLARRRVRATHSPQIEKEYAGEGIEVVTSRFHGCREARGSLQGIPFVLTLIPGGGSTMAHTMLVVSSPRNAEFDLTYEGSKDLVGHDRVESLFQHPDEREAVRALFRLGFWTIELHAGQLTIRRYVAALPKLAELRTVIGHLSVLRA